jgi:hypothetical protein
MTQVPLTNIPRPRVTDSNCFFRGWKVPLSLCQMQDNRERGSTLGAPDFY